MEITNEDWMLRTTDEEHYDSCLAYAKQAGVPVDPNDSEYDPTHQYTEIVWMGPGLGSLHFEEGGHTQIDTKQFKAMCDAYAANPVTAR